MTTPVAGGCRTRAQRRVDAAYVLFAVGLLAPAHPAAPLAARPAPASAAAPDGPGGAAGRRARGRLRGEGWPVAVRVAPIGHCPPRARPRARAGWLATTVWP